ncbi:MAG: phage BR0599 family protein, partial [Pseudomonadota bacterium]
TSGVNAGVTATVGSVVAGASMTLLYPLESVPATGDGFTVYFGCDHTMATCQSKFNNLANFRGFPFVPPPQMAV